jgi:hypothetical protein
MAVTSRDGDAKLVTYVRCSVNHEHTMKFEVTLPKGHTIVDMQIDESDFTAYVLCNIEGRQELLAFKIFRAIVSCKQNKIELCANDELVEATALCSSPQT